MNTYTRKYTRLDNYGHIQENIISLWIYTRLDIYKHSQENIQD